MGSVYGVTHFCLKVADKTLCGCLKTDFYLALFKEPKCRRCILTEGYKRYDEHPEEFEVGMMRLSK